MVECNPPVVSSYPQHKREIGARKLSPKRQQAHMPPNNRAQKIAPCHLHRFEICILIGHHLVTTFDGNSKWNLTTLPIMVMMQLDGCK